VVVEVIGAAVLRLCTFGTVCLLTGRAEVEACPPRRSSGW
jgi:hypothetical protein